MAGGVKPESEQKQQVGDMVVTGKAFSPQKHRINHAEPVKDYGQQEEVSVSEPCHTDKLAALEAGASGNYGVA